MTSRKITKKILPNTLPVAALLVNCLFPLGALADGKVKTPAAAVADSSASRIKVLTYDESNVYVIRTKFGYQTNIVFGPKEEIQTISIGDRSLWQIIPSGNRLFIRPMNDSMSTNMTLITNKHTYEFDLKSVDKNSESNIYVARFEYPQEPQAAPRLYNAGGDRWENTYDDIPVEYKNADNASFAAAGNLKNKKEAPVSSTNAAASQLNYSYTYSGADSLAPLQVYDNGKSTFIKYQNLNQKPDVFIIGKNGKEVPANAELEQDSTLVVSGVSGEMLLRSGSGTIRIYNELLNPR